MMEQKPILITLSLTMIILIVILTMIILWYRCRSLRKEPYRLGDFVRHAGIFKSSKVRRDYAATQHKNSLIRKYHDATDRGTDIEILSGLVPFNPSDKCIIHLRLGDVIDNSPYSVDDHWTESHYVDDGVDAMNGKKWKGSACKSQRDCKSTGYVHPKSFFERVCDLIPSQVVIVSGSHKNTVHPEKSQEYIKRVRSFLSSRGKTCELYWNREPDFDFSAMCNAHVLVPSGGGFSQLAASVVKHRGGTVLD